MYLRKHTISLLSSTAGTDTEYTPVVTGTLYAIRYQRSAAPLSTTAALAITTENSSMALLSVAASGASWTYYPRSIKLVTEIGGTIHPTSAASVNSLSDAMIPIVDERIKVALSGSSAGSQTGTLLIFTQGG